MKKHRTQKPRPSFQGSYGGNKGRMFGKTKTPKEPVVMRDGWPKIPCPVCGKRWDWKPGELTCPQCV